MKKSIILTLISILVIGSTYQIGKAIGSRDAAEHAAKLNPPPIRLEEVPIGMAKEICAAYLRKAIESKEEFTFEKKVRVFIEESDGRGRFNYNGDIKKIVCATQYVKRTYRNERTYLDEPSTMKYFELDRPDHLTMNVVDKEIAKGLFKQMLEAERTQ